MEQAEQAGGVLARGRDEERHAPPQRRRPDWIWRSHLASNLETGRDHASACWSACLVPQLAVPSSACPPIPVGRAALFAPATNGWLVHVAFGRTSVAKDGVRRVGSGNNSAPPLKRLDVIMTRSLYFDPKSVAGKEL